ncbi:Gfo/Idh/MocA family protein [Frigidibacter sp. ROC022]|uniref:Gfo/Idh/MocA family protein n=1 Tax=Frigidibacter sp. ROC022 TaxID=2971796 RepID=UPI00215B2F05|nr:Gfo/Idh/MocA family oxidoreductase [Frigidibacter sp. ROC022]MCR8722871.1 Gfo/Idh/MocA family oxidoreductase [Frigidibacter sp. ROC022]
MKPVGIGIVGLGNISGTYLAAAAGFPLLDIRAVADLNPETADRVAAEHGLRALPLDAIFTDPEVEVILNLTIPRAHVEVGLRAIAAGRHVYSEKPLGISFAEGRKLLEAAEAAGLRVGAAPDTFLGGGHQTARALLDSGAIGKVIGGTAVMAGPGHERWHPDPDFYYDIGGGPMLDMGPYYLTDLVNLLGPVASVAGVCTTPRSSRTIASGPRQGEVIPVRVPTHIAGLLHFVSGTTIQITMSFDVQAHRQSHIELWGSAGSLIVPDPNRFGGRPELWRSGSDWTPQPVTLPFAEGNLRSLGLAEMAEAIRMDRPHRASGALALHVLEVMEAIGRAGEEGRMIEITTDIDRPAPLGPGPATSKD